MTIRLTPEAEADLTDPYAWYRDRGESLASDFLAAFQSVLEMPEHHPETLPDVDNQVRRALMRSFPYAVFYVLGASRPVVIAVFHARRNPTRWKRRAGA